MSESAGRYQRSPAGMVGALLVTLGVIVAFVLFRAANRDELEVKPENVDYLATVRSLQSGGMSWVAYPPTLPEGWQATRVDIDSGGKTTWALNMLTGDERYVGVRQSATSVEDLVEDVVGEEAEEAEPVKLQSPLAEVWRVFTDPGGDYAVVTAYGETVLLVVGTTREQAVRDLAASLVTTPLA